MYFQIKEIILWPRNSNMEPRRLLLELGKVNVISGASKTGKSAIIPIIDYCLGSDKCTIPVNTIRNLCEWFGVIVQTPEGQKLFARREPGSQKTTSEMFVLAADEIDVPTRIQAKNTTADAVKRSLDSLAGLSSLDFDLDGTNSGFRGRPSFRDLGAFIFQPQNIIANPDVLFYKADTYEHREKLRTIFPYVLDAISSRLLAKQHELSQLVKELRRKRNELTSVRQVSEEWIAEIQARASEARELGLIQVPIASTAKREDLLTLLNDVVQSFNDESRITIETVNEAVEELDNLQKEEGTASLVLSTLRKRLSEMNALRESAKQYHGALIAQQDRLQISDWLRKTQEHEKGCPICGNSLDAQSENLNKLYKSLEKIEEAAGQFSTVPAAFDREFERVRSEVRVATEKLGGIKIRIKALERTSEYAKKRQYDSVNISRFIGNLEQALQTYSRIGRDSDLENEVRELQERVQILEKEISGDQIKNKTRRALLAVCSNAQKLLPDLDIERPGDPISLSVNDLTIRVEGIDREDYLWEIGSGANWLGYHIAVTLGLHQFFLSLSQSPVPTFVIYDQPSQVYFPKRLASRGEESLIDPSLNDEDIIAVRKVFDVLSSVVEESKGNLQVIVLDHAADDVWGEIANIHLVEEWRDGKKLVPIEWLTHP